MHNVTLCKKKNWDHLQSFTSVGFWSQPSEVGYWTENSWAGHSLKCTQAHNTQYITEGASFTHHSEIWMSVQPGSFSFSHSHWPKFYLSSGKRWFLLPEEVIWIARSSIGGVWPVHIWCGFKIAIYGGGLTFFFPIHLCQSSLIPGGPFHLLAMLAWETSRWSLLFFLSFISKSPVLSSVLEQITCRDLSSLSDSTLWGLCQILWWAQLSSFVWTLSGSPLSTHPIPLCQVSITEENSTQDFSGHTRQKFRITS